MECVLVKKTQRLFEKLVEPGYVMDYYYADNLINKLQNQTDSEVLYLISTPQVTDSALKAWDKTENAHITVKVFLTRIIALVAKKELHFTTITTKLGTHIIKGFKEMRSPDMSSSLRVAFMEIALATTEHHSGLQWIFETGVWKDILSLSYEKYTVFVVRQTYKFVSNLMWKLNDYHSVASIKTVFDFILKPLSQNDFLQCNILTSEDLEDISRLLEPMLQMLLSILSKYDNIMKSNFVISVLLEDSMLHPHLLIIFDRIRDNHLILLLSKVSFLLLVAKVFHSKPLAPDIVFKNEDFIDASVWYFNFILELIRRRNTTLVLDFCNSVHLIWSTIWMNKNGQIAESNKSTLQLHNQLLVICLVPCIVYGLRQRTKTSDETINDFIYKLAKLTCEHTAKAAYAIRDLMNDVDMVPITLQAVKKLTCFKNHLNNEQANLVFQTMFYILKEYDPTFGTSNAQDGRVECYDESEDKVIVITYVLDMVLSLVNEHNIHWHESLEIICLYNVVFNILQRPNLTCKFVVTALNVIALTVKKFLPPNLSLLMDTKPGSAMHELGRLIYMKMNSRNWEIRDSALELLLVCTEISYIKFPHLQKQIIENKLINTAATMALHDHEYYVQASALKCLAAATKISTIWEQLLMEYPNVQVQLLSILQNNSEGIVRKEACNVLCEVYQNVKQTPDFNNLLYEHMYSSAIGDFHWEVQLTALKFWRETIHASLRGQGMLDGKFPPVTFSRQSRKIVTLNKVEIQKILRSLLDTLSSIGCLTVLVKLLKDQSEIEIMEAALSVAQELLDILVQYDVPEFLKPSDEDTQIADDFECHIKDEDDVINIKHESYTEIPVADNVIESIVNADDVNLLANIYETQMNLNNQEEINIKPKEKLLLKVSPYSFVQFLQSHDFKQVITRKRQWNDGIRSLQSLLDDVLGVYDANYEVNSLDCY